MSSNTWRKFKKLQHKLLKKQFSRNNTKKSRKNGTNKNLNQLNTSTTNLEQKTLMCLMVSMIYSLRSTNTLQILTTFSVRDISKNSEKKLRNYKKQCCTARRPSMICSLCRRIGSTQRISFLRTKSRASFVKKHNYSMLQTNISSSSWAKRTRTSTSTSASTKRIRSSTGESTRKHSITSKRHSMIILKTSVENSRDSISCRMMSSSRFSLKLEILKLFKGI